MQPGDGQKVVAVVGAGVSGLAAAIRLAQGGHRVTVLDPAPGPGGLAGGFRVAETSLERFYHHVFRSDTTAQAWIREVGLGDRLQFLPASMGLYSNGQLYRFGTPLSLLRFPPLPPADRVRLGLRIRQLSATTSGAEFEDVTALAWLRQRASPAEVGVFWDPLLKAKFGADREAVSMAWLWARFRARAGTSPWLPERLGYLRGGFQQLTDAMAARARELGADIRYGTPATGITVRDGGVAGVTTAEGPELAVDGAIWTPALPALARAVPGLPPAFAAACAGTRYHHAVVVVVELAASVLPYYWVTIGDDQLPFTVAVEHTRLVPASDYGGRTIVYLGRYAAPGDPLLQRSDGEVRDEFLGAAAAALAPGFRSPLAAHVFRAPGAQPIVPPGWGAARPALRTGIRGLVAANMAQIHPWDRGINYSIELGESAAREIERELQGAPGGR